MKKMKDSRVEKFIQIVKSKEEILDIKSLMDELERLQATKYLRVVEYNDIVRNSQKAIVKATLQNQSTRSRCVEIKLQVSRQYNVILEHKNLIYNYLIDSYRGRIPGKNKEERTGYLENKLAPGNRLLAKLESVIELSDIIIDDCDKAAWATKSILDALVLSTRPERNI